MANTDRKCTEPGCIKYLSDYNTHPDKCFAHQPRRKSLYLDYLDRASERDAAKKGGKDVTDDV